MENYFKLRENGTNVRQEIMAGITTFLTMAYIIAVNPDILSATGMDKGALLTATCLSAGVTTILMGVYANLPFGLASGMGLNAFFAYSVVLGKGISWQTALTAVFVEGLIFIVLSVTKARQAVVEAIPLNMKLAVTAGIGLFIAFIGMVNGGIVINNDATLVSMGNFATAPVAITCLGIIIIAILYKLNIKGALLIGIAVCSIVAWIYAAINPTMAKEYGIYLPTGIFEIHSIAPIAFKLDFSFLKDSAGILSFITVMFTFLFVDFFDTVGTLIGVATKANMLDEKGNIPRVGRALLTDAIGTTGGALIGVSTVTTFVESSAGVAEGGRTGLASVATGILFLLAIFFGPLFMAIPSCATAPALIIVGFFMMENVTKIDFADFTEGVPAFLTIAFMPLTYSIGDGLTIGILAYVILNLINNIFAKNKKDTKHISIVMIVLAIIFLIKLIFAGH